ncbi:MAG: ABC transporter ATP-binding protein [Blautia sp.]|nr:ABC transporter ATP-binding protein [Lachnoclostridium sp.]MCM1210756.1 ABC transporter ATP-binding protein [Blautia sp.]
MNIVEVKNLHKHYGNKNNLVKAIDGVDFCIRQGEFVAIVGMSGSGKSTLLYMLGGLEQPTFGEIILDGAKLSEIDREDMVVYRRKHIGFIFQSYNLIPVINVLENITLPVELDGGKVDKHYLLEIIDFLGMHDKMYEMPNHLSGGQQQRVAIARALIAKPQIVLADEPTGNLDSKTSEDVVRLLKMTSKKFNQTIILITHNKEIAALADRRITIKDGKIIA